MSAASGIAPSPELTQQFAAAATGSDTRFIKVSIRNETLTADAIIPCSGTFEEDLVHLVPILEENVPAYILAKMENGGWVSISYVPDTAKVRDKMLYASSRSNLSKSLGLQHFTDNFFATSLADLTPEAYASHKAHLAAPKPLSAAEKEREEARQAEREAGSEAYEGSRGRRSHLQDTPGLNWADEVRDGVKSMASALNSYALVLSISTTAEQLVISESQECKVEQLKSLIPKSEPSYTIYSWRQDINGTQRQDIDSSPIKNRMLYSSGAQSVVHVANTLLGSRTQVSKKLETSDPSDLTGDYLAERLGISAKAQGQDEKAFARPRGPARKQRS